MMTTLAHRLERTLVVPARVETTFTYFADSGRWAAWWGAGSSIDARPGGQMRIRHANGVEVTGEILEVVVPARVAFTYGYATGTPIPPGGSRVTVSLDAHADGTRLTLRHELADEAIRNEHVQGWRFQLSLLANVIANDAAADAETIVDRWFATWSEPDAARRDEALDAIASSGLRFEDRFSRMAGVDEVRAHLAAVHRFMPGMRLERQGPIRHCQWHVLADWIAVGKDGQERGRGTNLFVLDQDGRIAAVTGFWAGA